MYTLKSRKNEKDRKTDKSLDRSRDFCLPDHGHAERTGLWFLDSEVPMKVRTYAAFFSAFFSFWFIMACLGCHVVGMKILSFILRVPRDRFMTDAACACMTWGRRAFRLIARIMSITVEVRYDGPVPIPPCLVISNHVSVMDVPLVPAMLEEHGFANARWAVKKSTRFVPVIGWCASQIGCAFLTRNKNPDDIEAMRRCGEMTRRQKAGFVLFVEGTRATAIDPSKGFVNVLPPKPGGFNALRAILPDAPVLVLTIRYPNELRRGSGKRLSQAAAFYGATIGVTLRLFTAETVNADPDWLMNIWKDVDASLSERA